MILLFEEIEYISKYGSSTDLGRQVLEAILADIGCFYISQNRAISLYKKLCDDDNPIGQYAYSLIQAEINTEDSIHYLKKAAKSGFAPACNTIGACYQHGVCFEKSLAQSVEWYSEAAKLGYFLGARNLALLIESGEASHHQNAEFWFRKAAELGDSFSAMLLSSSKYSSIDKDKFFWLKMAADLGSSSAHKRLSSAYSFGGLGLLVDEALSDLHLREAEICRKHEARYREVRDSRINFHK